MKRLYLIILILLITSCGPISADVITPVAATAVPEAWLTSPPTPAITRLSEQAEPLRLDSQEQKPEPESAVAQAEETAEPGATSTPVFHLPRLFGRQWSVSARPGVPDAIKARGREIAGERPEDFLWVEPGSLPTDITISLDGEEELAQWLYVAAAPFATIEDDLTTGQLRELWSGDGAAQTALLVGADEADALEVLWGEHGSGVSVTTAEAVVEELWTERPALTILPFEKLTPELKVLRIDGSSPLQPEFEPQDYPLATRIGLDGEQEALAAFLGAWDSEKSNYDADKLTRVAMTGVTALVRATATQMEIEGILMPARDVGPLLRAADIAHISNEVSFSADCPEPNPIGGTSFCSQDEYFALLEEIGTDVIELTGNHLNDWGADNLLLTIDMYEAAGMDYFGGGRDAADAARAALFELNGNRIALVGCNFFGPQYAWAGEDVAGSRACDQGFFDQISQLNQDGYVVLATQQYTEYYQYPPTADQEQYFRSIADAGAAAVSGSQGHHAQGFDFYNGAFIHYGLGNLFFDQMDQLGTRQTFVDTYSIYDGRLINVDLWTGLIENFALPREMTAAEREQALQAVFEASGW